MEWRGKFANFLTHDHAPIQERAQLSCSVVNDGNQLTGWQLIIKLRVKG